MAFTQLAAALLLLAAAEQPTMPPEGMGRLPHRADDISALGRLVVPIYTSRDGLPVSEVNALSVDAAGYLWVGTSDGVLRFNGRSFEPVTLGAAPASRAITALLNAGDGALWVGTANGLHRIENGAVQTFDTRRGLPSNNIQCLLEDGAGEIWIGTDGGLVRYSPAAGAPRPEPAGPGRQSITALYARDGALYVGANRGLWIKQHDTWQSDTRPLLGSGVSAIIATDDPQLGKGLWLGTPRGLVRASSVAPAPHSSSTPASNPGGALTSFASAHESLANLIAHLIESRDDQGTPTLWIGTHGGGVVQRFADGSFTKPDVADGALLITAATVYPSAGATRAVWLGVEPGGLARVDMGAWRTFDRKVGLPSDFAYDISQTKDGDHWFGMRGGLARFHDGRLSLVLDKSSPFKAVSTFLETEGEPAFWVGTVDGALGRYDPKTKKWSTAPRPREMSAHVTSLLEAEIGGDKKLIVGTDGTGIWVRERGLFRPLASPLSRIWSIRQVGRALWFASVGGGVGRFEDGAWTIYNVANGFLFDEVFTLHEQRDHTGHWLWAGTSDGAARLDLTVRGARWESFTDLPLPNKVVNAVEHDRQGRVYLFTNRGVCRLEPLAGARAGEPRFAVRTFTSEDGIPDPEFLLDASLSDDRGRLWGGTVHGAVMFDPEEERADPGKRLMADKLWVNHKPASSLDGLGHRQNQIAFELLLLNFFHPAETLYRTQLVGLDDAPSEWGADFKKEFSAIPNGRFALKAWAKDYTGRVYGPIALPFSIPPAPWQTPLAYGLYVLLGSAGVGGFLRVRLSALRRKNLDLEAKVNERTLALARKNDELSRSLRLLSEKNAELLESNQRADRIFSALADALPGTIIDGKYRLDEKIGQGGFGAVYRGTHLQLARPIAIKIFRPESGNDSAEALDRFRQEGVSASRVQHPNAVAVLDAAVSSEGIAYLVMELLVGRSLKDELARKSFLSLARCREILLPVCDVLQYLHGIGIVHRDIKPDNIFLHQGAGGEVVKVVDFGIAKQLGDGSESFTMTGHAIGTVTYMAPERLRKQPYDGSSDVYSLGVVLYRMLSGRLPFTTDDYISAVMTAGAAPLAPLSGAESHIPAAIDALLARALNRDPSERPTPGALSETFARALVGLGADVLAREGGPPRSHEEGSTAEVSRSR